MQKRQWTYVRLVKHKAVKIQWIVFHRGGGKLKREGKSRKMRKKRLDFFRKVVLN